MAEEKKCKHCAMMIPKDAKICPHCRKKLGWTLPAKLGMAFIILMIIGTIMGKGERNKQIDTAKPQNIQSNQLSTKMTTKN